MLAVRLPAPELRPRIAHQAALRDALAAAHCALRLAVVGEGEPVKQELLRTAAAQLEQARRAAERMS